MYIIKFKEYIFKNNDNIKKLTEILQKNIYLLVFSFFLLIKLMIFKYSLDLTASSLYLFSCIGSILLISSVLFIIKRTLRFRFIVIFDIIISILLFSDATYFNYYRTALSVGSIFQIKLITPSMSASITQLVRVVDLLFFADIFLLFYIKIKKSVDLTRDTKLKKRVFLMLILFSFGFIITSNAFMRKNKMISNQIFNILYNNEYIISNIGILNYHGLDIYSFINNNFFDKHNLTIDEKEYIKNKVIKGESSYDNSLFGSQKGKNLIILQVECMQDMFLDMKINGNEVTPYLNKFKNKCVYFDNFYAQTGVGNTSDAEFLVNNSLYPINYGSVYYRYPENHYNALPKLMKNIGYDSFVVHGNEGKYWNREEIYSSFKFDKFYTRDKLNDKDIFGEWGISDESMLSQSLNIMKKQKNPFYAFLITVSSHFPYSSFKEMENIDTGEYEGKFYGNYIKSMNYIDKVLGDFIDGLKKEGLLNNSVIVIYGDHNGVDENNLEDVMEHNNESHFDKNVELFKMKNVPLLIYLPDNEEVKKYDKICGQIDVLPTLTNLFGIKSNYVFGKDLLNEEEDIIQFTNGNYTNGKTIYINSTSRYYDLDSGYEVNPTKKFEKYSKKVKDDLFLSNTIVENNLLEYFDR
ncbi:MAG: LTA synthase family protein [Clostridiales bacterium]